MRPQPAAYGTCAYINFDNLDSKFLNHVELRFETRQNCYDHSIKVLLHDGEHAVDYDIVDLQPGSVSLMHFESIIQVFRYNRRLTPCDSKGSVFRCLENCILKIIDCPCRYPFLNGFASHLPLCNSSIPLSRLNKSDRTALNNYFRFELRNSYMWVPRLMQNCICPDPCNKNFYMASTSIKGKSKYFTGLKFHIDENVKILKEVLLFDKISLFCEFGGIFGLYFGWSILSIISLVFEFQKKIFSSRKKHKFVTRDILKEKTRYIYYVEKKGHEKRVQQNSNNTILGKILEASKRKGFYQYSFVGFIFFVLATERIYYYFTNPTSVTVEIFQIVKTPVFPFTVCKDSEYLFQLKKGIKEINQSLKSDIDIRLIDLIGLKIGNFTFSTEHLWSNLTKATNIFDTGYSHPAAVRPDVFGFCEEIFHGTWFL